MILGMMWFDNDKEKPIEQKVREAKIRYERRYGIVPNVCYVSESVPREVKTEVELRRAQYILPWHFWIGLAENYEDRSDS